MQYTVIQMTISTEFFKTSMRRN